MLTGAVLGGDHQARAERYASYLDERLASITARTAAIPTERRPSVVHLASVEPLKVDGRNSIIDQWISTAGGKNAARDDIDGNLQATSLEQLLTWDPDVLIVGGTVAQVEQIRADPRWQRLKAVRADKVYLNPKGVFPWDRYGPEEALQIQWAARTLQSSSTHVARGAVECPDEGPRSGSAQNDVAPSRPACPPLRVSRRGGECPLPATTRDLFERAQRADMPHP